MGDHWRLLKAGKLPFLGRYGNWLSSGNQVWSSWTLTEPYALQRPWQGCVSNSKLCLNWFLFIIQLISLPQISHAIWLYPSPEYFFISRNTHISFHSDLGITGASSVGWCISLAGMHSLDADLARTFVMLASEKAKWTRRQEIQDVIYCERVVLICFNACVQNISEWGKTKRHGMTFDVAFTSGESKRSDLGVTLSVPCRWYINKNQKEQTWTNMSNMWVNVSPFRSQCAALTPVCSL